MTAPNLFSPEDFDKLVSEISNDFVAVKGGLNHYIYSTDSKVGKQSPVGIYYPNAEHILFVSVANKSNPLVKYMMDNSMFTPEQYRYVESGGELSNIAVTEKGADKMATGGFVLSPEQEQQFDEWILDGNAHKNKSGKWTEQTTQWKKEFTLPELKTFFFKEFLADQYNDGHLVVGAKANSNISYTSRYNEGDSLNNPELAQELFNSGDTWGWDFYDKYGNQIDEDGQYMKKGGQAGKVSRPIKVRFHLGAGKNFMTWRIEDIRTKDVQFIDPENNRIVMYDCKLTNRPTTAKKIFSGAINKQPIAWIECIKVEIFKDTEIPVAIDQIRYNPRENINWSNNTSKNIDGEVFPKLVTYGRSVFVQSGDKYYELGGVLDGKGHGMDFDSVGTEPFSSVQTNFKAGGEINATRKKMVLEGKIRFIRENSVPIMSKGQSIKDLTVNETGMKDVPLEYYKKSILEAYDIATDKHRRRYGNDYKAGGSVGTSKLYTFKNEFRSDTRVLIKESPSNQKSIVSITVRKWSEKNGKPIIDIDKTLYLTSEEVKELLVKINKKNPKLIIF